MVNAASGMELQHFAVTALRLDRELVENIRRIDLVRGLPRSC
jgi:hypothetical protein